MDWGFECEIGKPSSSSTQARCIHLRAINIDRRINRPALSAMGYIVGIVHRIIIGILKTLLGLYSLAKSNYS